MIRSGKRLTNPKSVQQKMIILLVTIFIPFSLMLFFVYKLSENKLLDKAEEINRVTVEKTAARVQDLFQRSFMATNLFINDEQFLRALEERDIYDFDKSYTYLQAVERLQYGVFLNEKYAVIIQDLHGNLYESDTSRLGLYKGQLAQKLLLGMQGANLDFFNNYLWSMVTLTDTKGVQAQFVVITRWLFSPETANKKGILAIAMPIAYIERILNESEGVFEIRDRQDKNIYESLDQKNEGVVYDSSKEKFVAIPLYPTNWSLYQWRGKDFIDKQLKWFNLVVYLSISCILLIYIGASTYVLKTIKQIFLQIRSFSKQLAINSPVLSIKIGEDRHLVELSELLSQLVRNLNTSRSNFETVFEEKRKLEMQMLQQQLNPHFLLNTLSTIRYMADRDSQHRLSSLVLSLSFLLRQQLYREEQYWTLSEEKEYLEKYSEIQRARFGENIRVHIEVGTNTSELPILKMLIQPLLENSFEHAFPGRSGGHIDIYFMRMADNLEIKVRDNGIGINNNEENPRIKSRKSIGLKNVRERIRLHYGDDAGFFVTSHPELGTELTLILPIKGGDSIADFNRR
jgi:two-component system sensor histidine kinase YesM